MNNQKNRLREVLEAQNADTAKLKKQLKADGIPPSTLWKYINHPETEISGRHSAIIVRNTGCDLAYLVCEKPKEESAAFELSKTV